MGRLIDRGRRKGVKGQVVGVYSYPGFMARRVEGVTIAMQVGCPFFIKVCLISKIGRPNFYAGEMIMPA